MLFKPSNKNKYFFILTKNLKKPFFEMVVKFAQYYLMTSFFISLIMINIPTALKTSNA